MEEIWKDIKGYEGLYQVSNLGRVKSLHYNRTNTIKILKQDITANHFRCTLFNNKKEKNIGKKIFVHRLVAEAFIPNTNNYPIINHKDGNPRNNCADNLEWCTYQYNTVHALENGLKKIHRISMINKKTNEVIKTFNNILEIRKEMNFKRCNHIYDCCRKSRKSAYGYIWRYANDNTL